MTNGDDQPFLVNLWYYAVHTPVMGKKEKVTKYILKGKKLGLQERNGEAIPEHESWHHARQDNPKYAALVESLDENVGRLLDALKQNDLEDNTIVIFMSDNGGLSTGKGKKSPTSCLPLRAGKGWVYEGGIREPMIIKWPGVTNHGDVCREPVVSTDFYPTMLEMAGLPLRPKQHLDGDSLAPLLRGTQKSLNREALYFHFPQDHHVNSMGPSGAVRVGDFKLVEAYQSKEVQLYNLAVDLGEQNDLSTEMPEKTRQLTSLLHQWHADVGAQLSLKGKSAKK